MSGQDRGSLLHNVYHTPDECGRDQTTASEAADQTPHALRPTTVGMQACKVPSTKVLSVDDDDDDDIEHPRRHSWQRLPRVIAARLEWAVGTYGKQEQQLHLGRMLVPSN